MAYLASNKLGNYSAIAGEWVCRKRAGFILESTKELSQDKRQLAETLKGLLPSISANPVFWISMLEHWVIKHNFIFYWSIKLHKDT